MNDAPAGGVESRLAAQLEAIISKKLAADKLVLPSLPAAATRCLNLLKNPDFSLKEASRIIESDPMLTAQLLKLSNSAALGARDPIKSVLQAVTRFGVARLKTFLIEVSARRIFDSKDTRIASATTGLWNHSLAVASLSRDLISLGISGDPDVGYLAGLLHDIGKPVVATMLLDAERAVIGSRQGSSWITSTEWIAVVQQTHRRVGVAMAEKWELPEVVCRTIRDCEEYDNADRLSAANVVRFANALAKQNGFYVGDVSKDDNDALVMIGRSLLNMDEELVKRLVANLTRTVREQSS